MDRNADRNEFYVCDGGTVDIICRESFVYITKCVGYETEAQQYREIDAL
jgi:hypothetical protein